MMGRPKKHIFTKGERLVNRHKGTTRWTYIKDLPERYKKRRVMVVCDCGSIEARYLSEILTGKSTGCRKCMKVVSKGSVVNPDSLRQQSLNIGMSLNYFTNLKRREPEKYERYKRLGKGRLDEGWWKAQEGIGENPEEMAEKMGT